MRPRRVVTCFLARGGAVLLLRRSGEVGTYRGRWAGISGTMEGADLVAEALREVREETGLAPPQVAVVARGAPVEVLDPELGVAWEVHPVLATLAEGAEPGLDWEHAEARWVAPRDLPAYATVPGLGLALERVLHGP